LSARISPRVIFCSRFMAAARPMRQISERAPVALDRLKAPEAFALRGRKTGNECGPLTPFADDIRCKRDRDAANKNDGKICPDHAVQLVTITANCHVASITVAVPTSQYAASPCFDFSILLSGYARRYIINCGVASQFPLGPSKGAIFAKKLDDNMRHTSGLVS
jgi:hypothetical protein